MLEAVWEGLTDAGWILIPLVLASFIGWYLVFRRYFALSGLHWNGYSRWKNQLTAKNWESAIVNLGFHERRTAVGQALFAVFSAREGTRSDMENQLDEVMKYVIPELEKNLSTLAVLAAAAPLTGLLGTVDGIIHTFKVISVFGTGNTALMSDSISEALLATQNGLLCAFPLMIMQVLLSNRADSIERDAQAAGSALINTIAGAA
jgi:biopolymer transport protein ExbB